MSSMVGLRDAIVTNIAAEIPAFQVVRPYGGTFNREELQRLALKAPACLLVMMGGNIDREGGSPILDGSDIIAFIVTRGSSETKRDEAAIVLSELVAGLAARNSWLWQCARAPEGIQIQNLYSGAIDKLGVALWAVKWSQRLDIDVFDPGSDGENLPDFHSLYTDYDLAPADGVIEFKQTIQVGGEFMSAYGHMYVSTPVATAIAVSDTYQKAAGTTTLKLADDVDMPVVGRLRHTGVIAKPFLVTVDLSVEVDADAKVTLVIAKGGTPDENTEVEEEMTLAGGVEAISLDGLFSLDENEYVEVWVKADSTIGVTITKANVVIAAT